MQLGLKGKVVMVAAASRGLGRACALGFAREGARLSICARGAETLEATGKEIGALNSDQVLTAWVDLANEADITRWAAETVQRFGGVDVLVTNAGGPPHGNWNDFQTDEPWQQAFELSLLS